MPFSRSINSGLGHLPSCLGRVTGCSLFVLIACLSKICVYNRCMLEKTLKARNRGTNWTAFTCWEEVTRRKIIQMKRALVTRRKWHIHKVTRTILVTYLTFPRISYQFRIIPFGDWLCLCFKKIYCLIIIHSSTVCTHFWHYFPRNELRFNTDINSKCYLCTQIRLQLRNNHETMNYKILWVWNQSSLFKSSSSVFWCRVVSSPWRWRQYGPLKHYTASQPRRARVFTSMKTWNLTLSPVFIYFK